ncbi:MAG: sensor histidine kinase [bacterium]
MHLKNQEYLKAQELHNSDSIERQLATLLISQESNKVILHKLDSLERPFMYHLLKGYKLRFQADQENLEAFKCFSKALELSYSEKNELKKKNALIAILDVFASDIFIGSKRFKNYLDQYKELDKDIYDDVILFQYDLIFNSKANEDLLVGQEYKKMTNDIDSLFSLIESSHPLYRHYYMEKAMEYRVNQDYKTSLDYYELALHRSKDNMNHPEFTYNVNWQIAYTHFLSKNYEKASKKLRTMLDDTIKLRRKFYNQRLYAYVLSGLNKNDSAYYYLRKTIDIEYKIGYRNNSLETGILSVENETDKLKLDKLSLESKRTKNRNIAYALGGLLLFGGITFSLIQKNTRRKQLLAEQEKELQTQKLTSVLKEQELTAIDAMISGQEKERQQIANDLHDELGGLMATLKLHFNALQEKPEAQLFTKTENLIDRAYQKVRTVAHSKNSGVMANKGLLKALKDMARTTSESGKLHVEVVDFGLEQRLENSLELTIFRIIQELITNVIKHAEANQASIHLTQHEGSLNIMVEDNGKGFDTNATKTSDGMGINSIDKRIDNLGGQVTIDSAPNKGTTIIIDLPI